MAMNIEIICIGRLKERWLREAESEYLKRLAPYCKAAVTELGEARLPANAGPAEEEAVRVQEGKALLAAAEKHKGQAFVFALDMRGRQLASERFAEEIDRLMLGGRPSIVFLVGGSLGLPESVREKADAILSLSEMTFPHQLARVILLEQIYRSQKILRREPYHK